MALQNNAVVPLNETSTRTNNHAVIVSSSRYWFNYRHAVNALVFYQLAKSNGIPDENIILMLADDLPSNARNPHKNGMYHAGVTSASSLYDASTEVDYRGEDVTVETLVKVLLGRHSNSDAPSQHQQQHQPPVLHTDEDSNLLIYLTGHGGDQFFKFQDIEEITADEIASTLSEMHKRRKYKQVLVVADTCQAFTLGDAITAPNVMVIGSSLRGESSYAHHSDYQLGLSVIERYTHAFFQFINKANNDKNKQKNKQQKQVDNGDGLPPFASMSVKEAMVDPYPFHQQRAHVGFREDLMERDIDTILMSEFFMNNQLSRANNGKYGNNDNYMRLVSSSSSNDNMVPDITIHGWPKFVDVTATSERIRSPVSSASTRNLGARGTSALPLPSEESYLPMISDPSDGRFLGLVALFVGLVLVISKRT